MSKSKSSTSKDFTSKKNRPELDMDLDEIAEAQYWASRKERSRHKAHKSEHSRSHRKEEKRTKKKEEKKEKSKKSHTKTYDIKISESALRSILTQAGLDTKKYNVRLVAEKKSHHKS
ncbi:hypothetical protein GPJ56_006072 [Histomonas meleagridis]|uniref:uncharacterized protein n=1 Tax=Histomonas meleagridis TaxID=135588 RepID=UPI003559AB91|nr:hypothetical protein GPJ56_006072 [Histomonas meleagridis]KAH0807180.1 hypothetical protein GO595_000356 [Histomonas meleagridis]